MVAPCQDRAGNPNLLWNKSEGFVIFDHELCFAFLHQIGAQPGAVDSVVVKQHPLAAGVRRGFEIRRFTQTLGGLTDEVIADIVGRASTVFPSAYDEKIMEHLRMHRAAAPFLEDKIKAGFR